ncbi:TolC family protein [Aureivirga sp. CE67]|uniref:TolC family protein n=1 Tax=Aureivirga sp. CE67 TaxID=1788983 RepID=UPI0018CB6D57|nr:TolC family protein [Aureivirga sp. CE67]
MKKFLCIVVLLLTYSGVFSQEEYELQIFIDNALETHPSIEKAKNILALNENKIDLAKSQYLPNIQTNLGYRLIEPRSEITIPLPTVPLSAELYPLNNFDFNLEVNYDLYNFGRTKADVAIANLEQAFASNNESLIKQQISLEIVNLYYNLYFVQEARKVNQEQQELLHKTKKINALFYEQGEITNLDLLNTDAQLSQVMIQAETLENSLQVLKKQLELFTQKENINVSFFKTPFLSKPFIFNDSEIANNLEAKLSTINSDISKQQLDKAKRQAYPTILAQAKGGYKNGLLPDNKELRLNYTVGVGVQIPIFLGNRIEINKKIAQNNIDASFSNQAEVDLQVQTALFKTKENITQFFKKMELSEIKILQSEKAVEQAFLQYENGEITNLDLLRIEVQLANAKLQKIQFLLHYTLNIYAYKKIIGEQIQQLVDYE